MDKYVDGLHGAIVNGPIVFVGTADIHVADVSDKLTPVALGDRDDTVHLGDGKNLLVLGNGNDTVQVGNGANTITWLEGHWISTSRRTQMWRAWIIPSRSIPTAQRWRVPLN